MSFKARLLVERGGVRTPSQDWGEFAFLSAPSPGDRIAVQHEGTENYLTVMNVHHRPVPVMPDEGDPAAAGPTAEVVAKWTGSGR